MQLSRIIAKPFRLAEAPPELLSKTFSEEVIGMGYHPERVSEGKKGLISELPRIALDAPIESKEEIAIWRNAFRTGELGDGKIFLIPVLDFIEF